MGKLPIGFYRQGQTQVLLLAIKTNATNNQKGEKLMEKLFVYGTLMKGFWNNSLLAGCEKVANAKTVDEFAVDYVGFPRARKPYKNMPKRYKASQVKGEIWLVPLHVLVDKLDLLECVGEFYDRKVVEVFDVETGIVHDCFMYIWLQKFDGKPIPDGDFGKFVDENPLW